MGNEKWQNGMYKELVDRTTGEIIQTEIVKSFTKKVNVEQFYMTFIKYIAPIYQLKSDTAKSVLNYMCSHAEFDTGKVKLTAGSRLEICKYIGISATSLTNNLNLLKKLNLISGSKGDFIINPQIFWRGSMDTRDQILKNADIKVTFNIVDKEESSTKESKSK